jgi:energy-coupling factor transport system substrate-specific component
MKTKNIFTFSGSSSLVLPATSLVGICGFIWPFLISDSVNRPQWIFILATPLALISFLIGVSNGNLDAKSVALLAVMSALIAALRPLGTGAVGIEPMWFVLILSARVFGPSFGFLLGALSMILSAFITGGIGPWLAYQAFAAAWIGLGVGLIPRNVRGKIELSLLVLYGICAAEFFGIAMDLQFWPWYLGSDSQLSFQAGASFAQNLGNFFSYHFLSAMAWDVPRAIFTSILLITAGTPVLHTLRRAHTRARFLTPIEFREFNERATRPSESKQLQQN